MVRNDKVSYPSKSTTKYLANSIYIYLSIYAKDDIKYTTGNAQD